MKYYNLLTGIASAALSTLSLSALAQDCCSGPYIGLQAGYSHTKYDLGAIVGENLDKDGAAGRAYVGYQFNQNLGLETGFALFSNVDLPRDFGDIKTAHWDLLLKVGTPIGNSGVRFDVKGGAAYIMSDFDAHDIARSSGFYDDSEKEIKPMAGVSLTTYLNRNVGVDVSYLHTFGDPKNGALGTPNVDLLTLGLSFQAL